MTRSVRDEKVDLSTLLKPVGIVLAREALREESRKAMGDDRELNRHCGRIANAAEWLFDSEGGQSATNLVQLAIAFEALEAVFHFESMRHLERHSRGWFARHKKEAAEALEILRQRKMLLRQAAPSGR